MWKGKISLKTPFLFSTAVLFNFTIGGLTGIYLADVATDLYLQDTYFVVAHFHYTMVGGVVFAFFGAFYYWFPKITGRMYNEGLGKLHALLLLITFNLTFMTMFWPGLQGMNRRVAVYPDTFSDINGWVTIFAILLGLSFLPFILNIIISLWKGTKAPNNPWGGKTLEWETTSPPSIENFDVIPTVQSSPYIYDDESVKHAIFNKNKA